LIQSFGDRTTADLFREANTRSARRVPRDIWRIVQRKLKVLDVAAKLDDLAASPGNRLELLKGDQAGRHSIRVNDQYRVTFRWENGNAYEVRVEDYH
jgi:proteic killer suppression protein